ncbi:hypothetical protein Pcinc_011807 [Petrolisthes cinctipes]|uniref:Uncharacterized protein n=1 Tax=Petrolisthes cinctipes TaxID=88211 RepID=A0AAE1G0M1_PETCI|nr:hypothetical protein Pcinc_011807 [Petrolisthes cinctipes]
MNYSGPASLAEVEADLLLSDEEDIAAKHWPPLESHTQHAGPSPWQPHVDVPQPAPRASTFKRSMDQTRAIHLLQLPRSEGESLEDRLSGYNKRIELLEHEKQNLNQDLEYSGRRQN